MTDIFQIPLVSGSQTFQIRLGANLFTFTLVFRKNSRGGSWYLDLELADGSDAVLGIPLVIGVDLLAQFKHKGFGSLVVTTDNLKNRRPNFADMGKSVSLYWSES